LDYLEGTESDSGGGVDTGTDQDKTQGDTDNDINNTDNNVEEDSDLEDGHVARDFVSGLFGLDPVDEDPSDSDGGVDGTEDGDHHENTRGEGGPAKALSSFFQLFALIVVDGFGIRHLDELVILFGRHGIRFFGMDVMLSD